MMRTTLSVLLPLTLAALLGSGCIKAKMSTELKEDGSGSVAMNMAVTEKMVTILQKLQKIDPKSDQLQKAGEMLLVMPTDEQKAEMAEKGLTITSISNVNNEKEMSSAFAADFASPDALEQLAATSEKGASPMKLKITRDDEGIYTMTMVTESGDDSGDADEGMPGDDSEGGEEDADGEDAAKKMADSMALMGEMMGEMASLEMLIDITAPGEIVDFKPTTGGTQDGNTVNWKMDFSSLMAMSMEQGMAGAMEGEEGASSGDEMDFQVRFKMPEGKELPASILSKATPKPAVQPEGDDDGMDGEDDGMDDDDGDEDGGDEDGGDEDGGDEDGGDEDGHNGGDDK